MYSITERLDGTFECSYRIQDGTEYFTEKTLDRAIGQMILAAKLANGMTIAAGDIAFSRERDMLIPAHREVVREAFFPAAVAAPTAEDVGEAKYPPGLKGLLMKIADRL